MSNENTGPNPYGNRDHVDSGGFQRDDVLAVAGLLGQVSGSLSDIDSKNVGSASENVRAKKLNAKEALNKIIGAAALPPTAVEQPVTHQPQPHIPPPARISPPPPPLEPTPILDQAGANILERRVDELESIIESYKKIVKFKRGISYSINTVKIKGEFKDPTTILDLISTELAKQTKIITLKLNDSTKLKK